MTEQLCHLLGAGNGHAHAIIAEGESAGLLAVPEPNTHTRSDSGWKHWAEQGTPRSNRLTKTTLFG